MNMSMPTVIAVFVVTTLIFGSSGVGPQYTTEANTDIKTDASPEDQNQTSTRRQKRKKAKAAAKGTKKPKRERVIGSSPAADAFAGRKAMGIYYVEKVARDAVPDVAPVMAQPESAPDPTGTPNDQTQSEQSPPPNAVAAPQDDLALAPAEATPTAMIEEKASDNKVAEAMAAAGHQSFNKLSLSPGSAQDAKPHQNLVLSNSISAEVAAKQSQRAAAAAAAATAPTPQTLAGATAVSDGLAGATAVSDGGPRARACSSWHKDEKAKLGKVPTGQAKRELARQLASCLEGILYVPFPETLAEATKMSDAPERARACEASHKTETEKLGKGPNLKANLKELKRKLTSCTDGEEYEPYPDTLQGASGMKTPLARQRACEAAYHTDGARKVKGPSRPAALLYLDQRYSFCVDGRNWEAEHPRRLE